MARILVTGAGGFIGSHLARVLKGQGHFVRVADIKWDGYMKEDYWSERVTLDLRCREACLAATEGIEEVYNLAANMGGIGFITSVGADVAHDNVLINAHMLQASAENGVSRFFFSSSACVYPEYRQLEAEVMPLREEDALPADPDSFYGWEKLFTEKMAEAYARDYRLDVRLARFHNIYGPEGTYAGGREKAPAALCRKVAEALDGGTLDIWGDGKQTRSYCYIDDCVDGILALMASNCRTPVNIGSDRLVSVDELADIITRIAGKTLSRNYVREAPQGVRGRNADLGLARRELGWEPRVTLEKGLERTYDWIRRMVAKENSTGKETSVEH